VTAAQTKVHGIKTGGTDPYAAASSSTDDRGLIELWLRVEWGEEDHEEWIRWTTHPGKQYWGINMETILWGINIGRMQRGP